MPALQPSAPRRHEPLHPALTHFPIALWSMTFVCNLLSLWMGNVMVRAGFYALVGGTAVAAVAALAGLIDYAMLPSNAESRRMGLVHALAMMALTMFFVADIAFQRTMLNEPHMSVGIIVLTGIALAGVYAAAFLGHVLVFDHAANVVVRLRRRTVES